MKLIPTPHSLLCVLCALCALCGQTFSTHSAFALPNIILIYTDDHGWPDIGAQGIYDDLRTPHIDALAASGVRATNGYSSAPQCVPSRAGLLIGKHQNRFGVESNGGALDGFDAELTIAERLKNAGYATGQIGKWHLGPTNRITNHGFDDVYSKNANRPCDANYTLEGDTIPMQQVDDGLYHLDACTQAALTFIRRHTPPTRAQTADSKNRKSKIEDRTSSSPFFLYLAYRAPHVPLDAPEKYLSRFPGKMPERRRQALAMISAMDDGVGAITRELKARGLDQDTLIFYIGDNGAPLKIHKLDAPGGGAGWDGSLNHPMNGEKGMLAEGGMRVPFLISWPGTIPAGQVYDHPVISFDVAATAIELAGLPADDALDGTNLIPFLTGKADGAPHAFLTWRWIAQAAVREGKWKLLRGGAREYLFDLEADPGETKSLLAENPETAERLRARLESWASELNPPGLETKTMSETWEDYYDFYLDHKPAAPLREKFRPEVEGAEPSNAKTQGWIARNAVLTVEKGALVITPEKGAKQAPFIAQSKIDVPGPCTARVDLQSNAGGTAGFSWRLEGQKDFPAGQSVTFDVPASADGQDFDVKLPAGGRVIHLRLRLPRGASSIRSIELRDSEGKSPVMRWNFGK